MTGDALDFRIVETISREFVVRAHPFEHGGAAEDQIGLVGGRRGHCRHDQGQKEESKAFQADAGKTGKRDDMKFSGNKSPQCRYETAAQEDDGPTARPPFTAP